MDLHCPKSPAYSLYTLLINVYYVHLYGRSRVVWNNGFSFTQDKIRVLTIILFWSMINENRIIKGAKISVQFSPVSQLCPTLCNPMDCSLPGLPVHRQLPEFTQTHVRWSVMLSNYLILCRPLLLLLSIFPSVRVFSSESVLRIKWPKY